MNSIELKGIRENGIGFSGIFLLRGVTKKVAKNGRSYLLIEVGDRYGSFTFNCYEDSPFFNFFLNNDLGAVIQVDGLSELYNDRFSPRIMAVKRLTQRDVEENNLAHELNDGPKETLELLRQELTDQIARIRHPELKKTVENALAEVGDSFWTHTAAISMHHAYKHGLLEHSVHVARAGIALLSAYPFINADLAIAGMILHDIGKTQEYSGAVVFERTEAGLLEGHVVLGYRIVRRAAIGAKLADDLLIQLEHIILSHQGRLEYGAAVLPSTPEGVFVSLLDNLDARMNMVERALDTTPANQKFSEKIAGLDNVRVLTQR